MRLIRLLPPVLTLALLLPAAEASAQRLSLDGTLGSRTGSSERYVSHQALDLDLTLGMRTRGGPGTSFAAALSLGAQAEAPGDLVCEVLEEEEVPECARMPGAVSFAALAGLQRTSARGMSVRALAGPLLHVTDSSPDRRSFGFQARLDGAMPVMRHVSLVASARGTLLPEHEGSTFRLLGLGLGLRIH